MTEARGKAIQPIRNFWEGRSRSW